MITVLIYAVMTGHEYEFRLDCHVTIGELIEEIAAMICQREQCEMVGETSELVLYSSERMCAFKKSADLASYGVGTGEHLKIC